MKKLICVLLAALCLLSSCGGFQSVYPDVSSVMDKYKHNAKLFLDAAAVALAIEGDCFISTTEYYTPQNAGNVTGLYVSDVKETKVAPLEEAVISTLFEVCDVRSMATRTEGELSACEFNCGGSGSYYCGVYYVTEDQPIFIGNFSAQLSVSGKGYSYEGNGMRYYTEKISDCFYYFDAQT